MEYIRQLKKRKGNGYIELRGNGGGTVQNAKDARKRENQKKSADYTMNKEQKKNYKKIEKNTQ